MGDPTSGAGLPQDGYWYTTQDSGALWGSNDWIGAPALESYLTSNPAGSWYDRASLLAYGSGTQVAPYVADLQPGDLIFYEWSGGGQGTQISHVTMVTADAGTNCPLVTGHTDNEANGWWTRYGDSAGCVASAGVSPFTYWLVQVDDNVPY
jgi:hypothetical protein